MVLDAPRTFLPVRAPCGSDTHPRVAAHVLPLNPIRGDLGADRYLVLIVQEHQKALGAGASPMRLSSIMEKQSAFSRGLHGIGHVFCPPLKRGGRGEYRT